MTTLTRQQLATDTGGFALPAGPAYFHKQPDTYGRQVHALQVAGKGVVGVVVKHPLKKTGAEGAYWFTAWTGPDAQNNEPTYFTRLADAKKYAVAYATAL